ATGKTRFEDGYGVVKNVGVLKAIAVNTYGMNFPHGLYVLLRDTNNEERRYFMGYLNFDGWKELIWQNPEYVTEVRTREVRLYPVYPTALPHQTFAGFMVTRDAAHDGGDFVAYFKDVKVIYDKAVLNTVRDFADEDLWGVQTKKENERKQLEVSRFGNVQVLRFLENEKMATENAFKPSAGSAAAENSDAAQ
ncbi:MAG TPA: flagellar filament outer layer protein FlaA, partial [Treponemataceae bacterium]|nr:flagellar filament outer layer protein FlaA [Treponemataceae bacterium]